MGTTNQGMVGVTRLLGMKGAMRTESNENTRRMVSKGDVWKLVRSVLHPLRGLRAK